MQKNIQPTIAFSLMLCFALYINISHAQKSKVNGDYTLTAIALEDNSQQDSLKNVPVFEDASITCLMNSQWEFNDASGFYKIITNNCTKGMRQISWRLYNLKGSNYFQFNRTSAMRGLPANDNYVFEVQAIDKKTFTLRYPILYADKGNAILFTFTRQQD